MSLLNTRETPEKAGRIYPPIIGVEYRDVLADGVDKNEVAEVEFSVDYEMDMRDAKKDIEVKNKLR